MAERPFRAPHHTASEVALCGGGSQPRPGEITLAHRGVLFLDELPEFSRRSLETLREPLEVGEIHIARAAASLVFPAQVLLVAAMNPCPCGFLGHTRRRCRCTPSEVWRYRRKISGPFLDRVDLRVELGAPSFAELSSPPCPANGQAAHADAIRVAVERTQARQGDVPNAALHAADLDVHAAPDPGGRALLERASTAARAVMS